MRHYSDADIRDLSEQLARASVKSSTPKRYAALMHKAAEAIRQLQDDAVRAQEQIQKFRDLYVEVVKKYADDACTRCANNPHINCGEGCPDYIEGDHGTIGGKPVDFHWTCRDFDWGECPRLENSPCHGCMDTDSGNFKPVEDIEDRGKKGPK